MLKHRFVEFMPDELEQGIIYISLEYGSVIHLCACGCGEEVNTPLSPTGWKLTYNGKVVTLHPSIGNWSYDCRSHYWIQNGEIVWAENWSYDQVESKRNSDREFSDSYFKKQLENDDTSVLRKKDIKIESDSQVKMSFWNRLFKLFN